MTTAKKIIEYLEIFPEDTEFEIVIIESEQIIALPPISLSCVSIPSGNITLLNEDSNGS